MQEQGWIGYALRRLLVDGARYFRETQFTPVQARTGMGPHGATFGDLFFDQELPADQAMGEWFVRTVRARRGEMGQIRRIVIEGRREPVIVSPDGVATLYVDPLDNSQGYHAYMGMDPHERPLSPHVFAAAITLVQEWSESGESIAPRFRDVVAAGMISLSPTVKDPQPLLPLPQEQPLCATSAWSRPSPFTSKPDGAVGLNATVIFEGYYPETRAVVEAGFRDVSGALRSMGCAALEMVYPAIGSAAGYVCTSQKLHELGAAWQVALSRGAVVFTWSVEEGLAVKRRPLDDEPYVFNSKMPVCIARDMPTAAALWDRIQCGYRLIHLRSANEEGVE
jgi:hypothetical protein